MPLALLFWLHERYDFLDSFDVWTLSSIVFLFLGGFIPLSYTRVFKKLILNDTGLEKEFGDQSEALAATWGEILLAIGTVIAFLATLGSVSNARNTSEGPTPEKQCLAAIRDYETLDLKGNPSAEDASRYRGRLRGDVGEKCGVIH